MQRSSIEELNISDVPHLSISGGIRYFDGDIAFANSIKTIGELSQVFKLNFIAFVFCIRGDLSLRLDDKVCCLQEHDALLIRPGTIVSNIESDENFGCLVIAVSADHGINFINNSVFNAFIEIQSNPVIKFTPNEIELMMKYYDLAMFKIEHPELNYGKETMMNLLKSYALDLLSSIGQHITEKHNGMLRQGDKLFHKFILMLASNEKNERSVQYFAEQLYVSPKYLTSICNQKSGKSASDLITASIIGRIRQLLMYSDKSIKEISNDMNFGNLSFFGKYVKKHLGDSPNNFRKKNSYGR